MPQNFFSPHIVCRPALPADAADVLEFTKSIWEGHDYIQYVWRDWLMDPQGLFAAAIYGPHTVGIGKVSLISPAQWWLEGLRVDPKVQGLKIGSHLFDYLDRWWLEHADGTIRLMTSSERVQVHHLSDRSGYRKIGEVRGRIASALDDAKPHAFLSVKLADVPDAVSFALVHLSHSNGLMDSGWRFSVPDKTSFNESASQNRLLWWRGGEGLLAYWEDDDDGLRVLGIGCAACKIPSEGESRLLGDLLTDVRRLAKERGFASVRWLAPEQPQIQTVIKSAGFAAEWEHTGYLYEKRRPGLAQNPPKKPTTDEHG